MKYAIEVRIYWQMATHHNQIGGLSIRLEWNAYIGIAHSFVCFCKTMGDNSLKKDV